MFVFCGSLAFAFPCLQGWGVPEFKETTRDTHTFSRRIGDLPVQKEGDQLDYRSILHRDGTVFSSVTLNHLDNPEATYRALGAKLVVGMPFKDIATSDSVYMRELPVSGDADGRRALRRLQEVRGGFQGLGFSPGPSEHGAEGRFCGGSCRFRGMRKAGGHCGDCRR